MSRKQEIQFWKDQENDILLGVPHYEPLQKTTQERKDLGWAS